MIIIVDDRKDINYKTVELFDDSSTVFINKNVVSSEYLSSDEIQKYQDNELFESIVKTFYKINHKINPKYRTCIDSILTDAYLVNTPISYDNCNDYKILYRRDNTCIISNGKNVLEVNINNISIEHGNIGSEVISYIFSEIYKILKNDINDYTKFFIYFSDIFNIEYKDLYDNVSYKHRTTIESTIKNKFKYLFSNTDAAMW